MHLLEFISQRWSQNGCFSKYDHFQLKEKTNGDSLSIVRVSDIDFFFFQAILDVMVNLQFTLVETLWKTFWRFSQSQAGDTPMAV